MLKKAECHFRPMPTTRPLRGQSHKVAMRETSIQKASEKHLREQGIIVDPIVLEGLLKHRTFTDSEEPRQRVKVSDGFEDVPRTKERLQNHPIFSVT
jgi:hypothetical protein